MDDIAIIELLRNNPQQGLYQLICAYRGLVGKICANILSGHQQDIDEVIADTFIQIWQKTEQLDPSRGSLKGLLIITARHQAINRLHKLTRANEGYLKDALDYAQTDSLDRLLAQEDNEQLQQAINLLPEPEREIFVRRHFLGEPVKEIAAKMQMSEKQISNRLYQSKLKLRQTLQKRGLLYE